MKISNILMTKSHQLVTVQPEQTVSEVVTLFRAHNIGALPVVTADGRLVGILSERDIVRRLPEFEQILATPVQVLMTTKVITAVPDDDLMSVAHTMTERRIRHLPVLEDGRLIGIISIGDVLKAQRDQYRGEIDTLETQILAGGQ
ncbi:MAG: CBS domain-containing protein [Chloroflexi bacterium]|nr:CBS domain-containing protein [Ardenticatenaceae bacterium]MBL1130869.1 CBS domain-containing protein [Chloroflexota bacterium]NOG36967.1 CBS domain-containing protein [Chloroflexota bacterium]GIK54508.1 MAG: signal transduction protein [Chloroflexota bacterium]